MPTADRTTRAVSFGRVAREYERGRPEYPRAAIEWLLGAQPLEVLDLGAGTGKLTGGLLAAGHRVIALSRSPRCARSSPSRSLEGCLLIFSIILIWLVDNVRLRVLRPEGNPDFRESDGLRRTSTGRCDRTMYTSHLTLSRTPVRGGRPCCPPRTSPPRIRLCAGRSHTRSPTNPKETPCPESSSQPSLSQPS